MRRKATFKRGDLILYDRFGTWYEAISPSNYVEDFAIGLVINVLEDDDKGEENSCAEIIKEDGTRGFFSFSYLSKFVQLSL